MRPLERRLRLQSGRTLPLAVALLTAALLLLLPSTSRADSGDRGVYVPAGATVGMSIHNAGGSPVHFVVGGEVSVVTLNPLDESVWAGGYVDSLWDSGAEAYRGSIGPEIGWLPLGIDAGYLLQIDKNGSHHGFTIRPVLTISFIGLGFRYGHLFGDVENPNFGELELLLKFPFPLTDEALTSHTFF